MKFYNLDTEIGLDADDADEFEFEVAHDDDNCDDPDAHEAQAKEALRRFLRDTWGCAPHVADDAVTALTMLPAWQDHLEGRISIPDVIPAEWSDV
ncbi:hypothetical protein ACK8OR_01805 [Jannaschia sp. KMU-145]|uniref:hypothetical protein n=1 Tax=Jannaschia halovivens TaxID=3388667 RepID=UPI00396B1A3C